MPDDYVTHAHLTALTSREAYRTLDTNEQERIVLAYLSKQDSCIADVADALGMERSTISARMNHLKNAGFLEYTGKRKSKVTGITAQHFKAKEQGQLFGV